jgi:hypothetical protein
MGRNLIGIESHVAWATPGRYTIYNVPCAEDGTGCDGGDDDDEHQLMQSVEYIDPSHAYLEMEPPVDALTE